MNEYPKQNIGKKKPINKVHNDKSFIKRSERDKTVLAVRVVVTTEKETVYSDGGMDKCESL